MISKYRANFNNNNIQKLVIVFVGSLRNVNVWSDQSDQSDQRDYIFLKRLKGSDCRSWGQTT